MRINLTKPVLLLSISAIFFSACLKDNNLYDDSIAKEEYKTKWESNIGVIDPNQTWETSVMSSLKVNVALDISAEYTINIYTANPLFDSNATLLAQDKASTGNSVTLNFAKPQDLCAVYVAAINSKNRYDITTVPMTSKSAEITLGNKATRTSRTTVNEVRTDRDFYLREESAFLNPSVINDNTYFDVTTIPNEDLVQIDVRDYNTSGNPFKYGDGKHYEIPAGKTMNGIFQYNQQRDENCVILVRGTWNVNKFINFTNNQLIIIEKGGKLVVKADIKFSSGARLVNKGTIETADNNAYTISFENKSNAQADCYNSGTINLGSGGLSVAGNNSQLYNCGNATMKYIDARGNCTFTNMGFLTAESTTKDNYITDGQSTAVSNFRLITCCHTSIDAMGAVYLVVCDNGRIDCKTGLYTGGGKGGQVYIGSNAIIKTKDWKDNGGHFYGSDNNNEASIFQFTGKVIEENGGAFSAQGYMYFDGDLSEDTYHINVIAGRNNWSGNSNFIKYTCTEATSPISIPTGDCTGGGYNAPNPPIDPPITQPTRYNYAFEDMGSIGDYDFNDVVLSVEYPVVENGQKNAKVYLMAAGGTLPISIERNGNTICNEIHEAMNVAVTDMVNTGLKSAPVVLLETIQNPGDTFDASKVDFTVIVKGQTFKEIHTSDTYGNAPLMIVVPGKWSWSKEHVSIKDAYSTPLHSFAEWAADIDKAIDWYNYPETDKTIKPGL